MQDIHPKRILDIATGTADFAIASLCLKPQKVIGVDIAEEMLERGRSKLKKRRLGSIVTLQSGDAEDLPFRAGDQTAGSDQLFDAAIIAFGVRNFENLERGLLEMERVLRHGGKFVVLEFSRPRHFPFRQIYFFYFLNILPFFGRHISRNKEAYKYLPDTVMKFPEGDQFSAILRQVGFKNIVEERLTFGIVTIYSGYKY